MANQAVGNGIAPGSKYNQDFPALASLYNRPHLGTESNDEKSSVVGPHTQARREFAIHNEDFPALSSTASNAAFPTSQFPPLSASASNPASTPPLATTGTTTTTSNPQQSSQILPPPPTASSNGSSWWSGASSWSSSTAPSLSTSSQPAFSPSWSSSWNTTAPSQTAAGTVPAQQGPSSWSAWSSLSSLASNSASSSPKSRPSSWPNSWSAPNASTSAIPSPLPSPSSSQTTPPASSPRSSPASSPTSATYSPPNGPGLSYSSLSANQSDSGVGQPTMDETGDDSRWGLTGLLSVIRMTHPDLNTLALGTDLTTLGLNLNSTEVLYATFAYPCVENPCRREPDFVLPYCYYMQPPALKTSHLSKFQLETLFYIFYNMPKDTLQVYAAKELFNRDWRYHKDLGLWFTRDPSTATGGSYIYFDINSWERRLYRDSNQTLKFMTEEEHGLL